MVMSISLLLSTHILLAVLLTASSSIVLFSAWKRHETKIYLLMVGTFVGTFVSGGLMVVFGLGSLGRICAAMTAATMLTLYIARYYRLRLRPTNPLS